MTWCVAHCARAPSPTAHMKVVRVCVYVVRGVLCRAWTFVRVLHWRGFWQALVLDTDGTFTGVPGGASVIGEYAPLAFPSPQCVPWPVWGGFLCPRTIFRSNVVINRTVSGGGYPALRSRAGGGGCAPRSRSAAPASCNSMHHHPPIPPPLPPACLVPPCAAPCERLTAVQPNVQTTKAMGPIRITRVDPWEPALRNRTYGVNGPFMDPCPEIVPSQRIFRFLTYPGFEHEVIITNSLPKFMEWRFFSPAPTESWLLRLFVVDPLAMDVFLADTKVNTR
jgi:hypothetical protein